MTSPVIGAARVRNKVVLFGVTIDALRIKTLLTHRPVSRVRTKVPLFGVTIAGADSGDTCDGGGSAGFRSAVPKVGRKQLAIDSQQFAVLSYHRLVRCLHLQVPSASVFAVTEQGVH